MNTGLFGRYSRLAGQALILAAVVAWAVAMASPLDASLNQARQFHPRFSSDDDFYSALIRRNRVVLSRLKASHPVGTKVSIWFDDSFAEEELKMITRLWLALLPQYPIVGDSKLIVCPNRVCSDDAELLARGQQLSLVLWEKHPFKQ